MAQNEGPQVPISLDPSSWAEAFEDFPGKLMVCERRMSDERYTNEIAKLPRPVQQFYVEVQRYDAVFVDAATGKRRPAVAISNVDLETKNRSGRIVQMPVGKNKATIMLSNWAKAKVSLGVTWESPKVHEGKNFMFRLYRSMTIVPTRPDFRATNVLWPLSPLPNDYKYDGEVQEWIVQARGEDLAASAEAVATVEHASREELIEGLIGEPAATFRGNLLQREPFKRASGSDKTKLVSGTFAREAMDEGLLGVDDEGNLVRGAQEAT